MRFMKITVLVSLILIGFSSLEQKAEADAGFSLGFSSYYPYPYYYRPYGYYRPYFYNPYFYPYYSYPYYSGYYPGPYYYRVWGEVRTEVKPQSARVFLDGNYVGVTDDYDGWWQRLNLPSGKHRIVFRAPGFTPYVVTMQIVPGQNYHIKYEMVPGQDVIDEREMVLPKREYEDQYSRRPHRPPQQRNYEPPPPPQPYRQAPPPERPNEGETAPADVNLTVQIEPPDATVYIDGSYYGTADAAGPGEIQVLLPPGTHRIEVVRPGYESYSEDVIVERNTNQRVRVTLRRKGQ